MMASKFETWRQKVKRHGVAIGVVGTGLVVVIALISFGYRLDWTGFNGNTKSGKTLWDWLQLLIIPTVLAIGGFWLNQIQKSREQKTAQEQAKLERELIHDNQQEILLQAYIDKVSELLLEKNLRKSELGAEVRNIARARTLTVLPRLDAERKKSVLQFLYESGLIYKDKSIVDLSGADLTKSNFWGTKLGRVNLSGANLSGAALACIDLSGADLRGADLSQADLFDADLSQAELMEAKLLTTDLHYADLSGANLSGANLSGANLNGAHLNGANLRRASLSIVQSITTGKKGVIIIHTDLSGANLTGADLSGAKLSGASLDGADLKDAIAITIEELEKQAKSLQGATMPDGSIHS